MSKTDTTPEPITPKTPEAVKPKEVTPKETPIKSAHEALKVSELTLAERRLMSHQELKQLEK